MCGNSVKNGLIVVLWGVRVQMREVVNMGENRVNSCGGGELKSGK